MALISSLLMVSGLAAAERSVVVGDGRLRVVLRWGQHGLSEAEYRIDGQRLLGVTGAPWAAQVDGAWLTPERDAIRRLPGASPRRAAFEGEGDAFSWRLAYELTGPGRVTKSLTLTAKRDLTLQRVSMWNARSPAPPLVSRTGLQDIAVFCRQERVGLFASLDFPYSRIATESGSTTVAYPPHEKLKAGQAHACHTLTLGATRLVGRERYGFDEGEVEAMDCYVQERYPPRFERPMFVACCMNNRYCQPEGDHIWYTMADHPTLSHNTDLLRRDLALMRRMGIEYYQIFPGIFDWVPGDPDPKAVKAFMDYSRSQGMRSGDYSTASGLFCGHYNEHRKSLARPEWRLRDKAGNPGVFSLGVPEYVDFYAKTVIAAGKRFGFEIHNLDFLLIAPDYSTGRPYPPGEDSVYHQVKGLVRLLEAIGGVSPEMMTWSNSGNWAELLPKLAWYNHNLYLTDPFIDRPWQGLNMTRLMDDARREQMVSLHYSRFIPYRFLTNYQYFFAQNSVVPDIRNYQYGMLSTVAVTPNLGIGDIRPWLDRLPEREVEKVARFYTRWTGFLKKHYDLWKTTYHAGGNPGMGALEIYSHARGSHGFVFVVNPQYWGRTVEVPLDATLGFSGTGQCEVAELYPAERLRLTPQGPFATLGTRLPVHVPAQQALVLEIRPAPKVIAAPRVYGLPGTVARTKDGYRIKTRGAQGTTERCAVLLPAGGPGIAAASVCADVPSQANRLRAETPLQLLAANDQGVLLELTFRRTPAPTELRDWKVRAGTLAEGASAGWTAGWPDGTPVSFPLFADVEGEDLEQPLWDARADQLELEPLASFCGAYVDNAYSEVQETWIDLKLGPGAPPRGPLVGAGGPPARRPLDALARDPRAAWWLQTRFHLPFIYMGGFEPEFENHAILVLPLLRLSRYRDLRAWINGAPLNVQRYLYPRNRGLYCCYADLVGSGAHGGDNTLVVYYEGS